MHLLDVIRLATRNFRNNRLRTFLTILAVSIATAAILFLVSFGYGLQQLTIQRIADSATISTVDVTSTANQSIITLDQNAIKRIRQVPDIVTMARDIDVAGQVQAQSLGTTVVHAIDSEYFVLADIQPMRGRIFSDKETHVAVVSSGFLVQFGLPNSDKSLGDTFKLTYNVTQGNNANSTNIADSIPFRIIGVVSDDQTSYVYLPIADTQKLVSGVPYADIKVQATNRSTVINVKNDITTLGYNATAPLQTIQQLNQVFTYVQIGLGALGIIALIISSIGMFNTMTIALLERTREIGVMKALGAAKSDVWRMFLAEATLIGLSGGIVGVLLGGLLAFTANGALNILAGIYGGQAATIFYSPPWFIAAIIIFSTVVGMITGFYPAKRAANLNPLIALRYE